MSPHLNIAIFYHFLMFPVFFPNLISFEHPSKKKKPRKVKYCLMNLWIKFISLRLQGASISLRLLFVNRGFYEETFLFSFAIKYFPTFLPRTPKVVFFFSADVSPKFHYNIQHKHFSFTLLISFWRSLSSS